MVADNRIPELVWLAVGDNRAGDREKRRTWRAVEVAVVVAG
jgi:hypothetical protein